MSLPGKTIFLLALLGLCQFAAARIGPLHNPSSSTLELSNTDETCLNRPVKDDLLKSFILEKETLDILIETSNRVTHRLISEILSIVLKEVVGYQSVKVVQSEGAVFTAHEALQRLSGCSNATNTKDNCPSNPLTVPESMINLEVWLSPGFDLEAWSNTGRIDDCGPLGPIGRAGWYVPKSVVKENWENKRLIIDHWRAFQNKDVASIFDLSKETKLLSRTRVNGNTTSNVEHYCNQAECVKGIYKPPQCLKASHPCATILADYPNHTLSSLKDDILKLNLLVQVAWVGPNLEKFVMERVNNSLPILFFNWKPNTLTHQSNFTNVAFPHCEDNNQYLHSTIGGMSPCEFEINQLEKIVWSQIKKELPDVYHVVRHVSFSQTDYLALLDDYRQANFGSFRPSIFKVACGWIKDNEARWHDWLPQDMDRKYTLYIGGIFPIHGAWRQSVAIAATMAIQAIDADLNTLSGYNLKMLTADGSCQADMVMKSFIGYVTNDTYKNLIGILGPACSETVEPIAGVAKHYNTIIISYSAEGALFNNREKYPYFFRTIPENNLFRFVYLKLFKKLGWNRISSLTEDGQKYPEYISMLENMVREKGMEFVINRKFQRELKNLNMTQYLVDLKNLKARIIIGDFYDNAARAVMCEAFKQNMTGDHGYQWFLPHWFPKDWYDTDKYNKKSQDDTNKKGEDVACSTKQMIKAINGHIMLSYKFYADDNDTMETNHQVNEWKSLYKWLCDAQDQQVSDYGGYAYDAVWVYAKALDALLKEDPGYRSTLHIEGTSQRLVSYINETDFMGVSGRVKFTGSSRLTDIVVWQWYNNATRKIGTYYPDSESEGKLVLNETSIAWLTPDKRRPHDGSYSEEIRSSCPLESLRKFLDVSCELSLVAANLMGLFMIALLVGIGFLFFKRRYEEKFKRIKELGLMGTNIDKLALDEWEMKRNQIVLNRKLGEGAFGTVYGGEAFIDEKGWVAVAVKTLKVGAELEEKLDFLSEAEMMKRFEHSNIVKLLGVCTIGEPVYTVMEFMLYGDLKTYLLARRQLVKEMDCHNRDEISDRQLTNMALDIARGLSYLAEQKYVHRDLACRNCLVNANRTVKIGDFGMCRHTYDSDYYRFSKKGMLPVRWMAPESLIDGVFTPMSDVWSYGVLLYEIVTFGSFPYQGLSNNQVLVYVKNNNTLTVPKECKPELENLFHQCWSWEPSSRPTAKEILEKLALNPNLISPCLDLPLASVEVEDTNSIELTIHDRSRVHSVTSTTNPIRRVVERHHSLTHAENGSVAVAALNQDTSPLTYRTQVIPAAKGQYVTLQCKNSQDSDYGSSASRDLAQGITAL